MTLYDTDFASNFVLEEIEVTVRPATTTAPTNVTTPTPTPTTNQTETTGPPPSEIACPPGYTERGPIDLRSGGSDEFSTDGGVTWNIAPIATVHPLWDTISGTDWISSGNLNVDTWYRVTFTLPPNFVNPSLEINFHADDRAEVYLNSPTTPPTSLADPGYLIGTSAVGATLAYTDPPDKATTTDPLLFNPSPSTNIIYFRVFDTEGDAAGLDYQANVRYCELTTPPPPSICPSTNVQHWDKIVFSITNTRLLGGGVSLPANTPLDIKVLDDPRTVADIKKKVLDFLNVPDNQRTRNAITIIDVEYAIVCAQVGPGTGGGPA